MKFEVFHMSLVVLINCNKEFRVIVRHMDAVDSEVFRVTSRERHRDADDNCFTALFGEQSCC